MKSNPGQLVEKTVGQKGQRGRQPKAKATRFDSAKCFLNQNAGQNVGWFLHGD
jgi:hypothetical protein